MHFSADHTVLTVMKLACTVYKPEASSIQIKLVKTNILLNFSEDPVL